MCLGQLWRQFFGAHQSKWRLVTQALLLTMNCGELSPPVDWNINCWLAHFVCRFFRFFSNLLFTFSPRFFEDEENREEECQDTKKRRVSNRQYTKGEFVPAMFDVCGPPLRKIMPWATLCQLCATVLLPLLAFYVSSCVGKEEMYLAEEARGKVLILCSNKWNSWFPFFFQWLWNTIFKNSWFKLIFRYSTSNFHPKDPKDPWPQLTEKRSAYSRYATYPRWLWIPFIPWLIIMSLLATGTWHSISGFKHPHDSIKGIFKSNCWTESPLIE